MNTTSGWRILGAGLAVAVGLSWGCGKADPGAAGSAADALASVAKTPEQEAQGAVEGAMAALKAGRLDEVYGMLPESYKKDVSGVVSAYVGKIDPELFRMGVETLGAFGQALAKQSENVVGLLGSGAVPFELDGDTAAAVNEALTAENLQKVGNWLAGCGEWLNFGALSQGDLGGLLGNAQVAEFVRLAWAEGEAKGPLSVRLAEDAPETDGAVRLEMGSEENGFEAEELVKVEGRWVPKEMADEWSGMIQEAMSAAAEFKLDDETVQRARKMLPALKRAMVSWGDAETPEELMGGVMGTVMTLGAMGAM